MKKKNWPILLSSLLIMIMILSACSGGGGDEGDSSVEESSDSLLVDSACDAVETYTGISRQACYTTACDDLEDTYLYTFDERTETDSCDAVRAVGICTTINFDTYYYEGDPEKLEGDCKYNIGTWSAE